MNYLITVNNRGYSNVTKEITTIDTPFKGEHNKYHYCYEVYVPTTNWYYRGSRSCKDWTKDRYNTTPKELKNYFELNTIEYELYRK